MAQTKAAKQLKDTLSGKPTVVTPMRKGGAMKPVVGVPLEEVLHLMRRLASAAERLDGHAPEQVRNDNLPMGVAGGKVAEPPAPTPAPVGVLLHETLQHSFAVRQGAASLAAAVTEGVPLDGQGPDICGEGSTRSFGPTKDFTLAINDNLYAIAHEMERIQLYLLGQ